MPLLLNDEPCRNESVKTSSIAFHEVMIFLSDASVTVKELVAKIAAGTTLEEVVELGNEARGSLGM